MYCHFLDKLSEYCLNLKVEKRLLLYLFQFGEKTDINMISNKKQFCFIICTNNKQYLDECAFYISLLDIPDGYTTDLITIEGATSITSAYNAAMNASEAKYKIYLHHDTMILNRYFLHNILKIFQSDDEIGMIGMGGNVHLDDDALLSFDLSRYVGYNYNRSLERYISNLITDEDYIYDVEAIDGFIMATQYDLEWREDIFDGWDFYDLSQSMEFDRKNLRVIVPDQKDIEWCFHADDMTSTLYEFEKYRKVFRDEYRFDLENYDIERKVKVIDEKKKRAVQDRIEQYVMLSDLSQDFKDEIKKIKEETEILLNDQDFEKLCDMRKHFDAMVAPYAIYRVSVDIRRIHHTLIALEQEMNHGLVPSIKGITDIEQLRYKYVKAQMMLRRIEMDVPEEFQEEAFQYLTETDISPYYISILLSNEYSSFSQTKRILSGICQKYIEAGDVKRAKLCIGLFKQDESRS
ncbi:Glycosyltransferase like family protein [Oribacterium sp. WCC10]|nr:Glycosyltransferase like family protein [Oribacterium sp. WCC10]